MPEQRHGKARVSCFSILAIVLTFFEDSSGRDGTRKIILSEKILISSMVINVIV